MKSRVSCCNAALLRRVLTRSALLWGAYLLIWLVALPANLLSVSEWTTVMDMKYTVLSAAASTCHVVSFCYSLAVAWFLYLYLHRSRSANFFGALPLRRETMFLTHYLAGILCSVVPNFLIMGATMLAGAANGANLVVESAIWFAAQSLTYVFYFSLAVLCAMLVGNLIAMPLLYVVLNFVVVVVEAAVRSLLEALLYGLRLYHDFVLSWMSPFYYAAIDGNGPRCKVLYNAEGSMESVWFEGWESLLILAAVGVVLAVAAFFLHKYRRMEVAGDVIAVKPLKPVFLYVFTFGCTLVGGTILAEMLVYEMSSSYFGSIAACLLASTVVGYFLGEMILQRSLRVFRKRKFLNCGICVVLAAALLLCVRLDVLGIESYVPDAEDVAAVRLEYGVHDVEDRTRIQEVIELHQEIIDRKYETEKELLQKDLWSPRMEITYTLKNGKEVTRAYKLAVYENEPADPDSLMYKYEEINNTTEMILSRELPQQDMTLQNIRNCIIEYTTEGRTYKSIDPPAQDALTLWNTAMLPDLYAGNMGKLYLTVRPNEPADGATYSNVSVEFELWREDGRSDYYYYSVPSTALHTVEALIEMGVPEAAFYLSYED